MRTAQFNKRWFLVLLLASAFDTEAQQPRTPLPPYGNTQVNYVRTWDMVAPETVSGIITAATDVQRGRMTTQYLDGLGRPVQVVVKQGSQVTGGSAVDLVNVGEYDVFGREQFKYLPFAANTTGNNTSLTDGLFKSNPFQQQAQFMQGQYGTQSETFFYGQTQFEASPLSRPVKELAPGNSWIGAARGQSFKYLSNTTTDAVRTWKVTDAANIGQFGSYASTATYSAGALTKTITEDEHGKQMIEFKSKEGNVVLRKVQLTAVTDNGAGSDHPGWLCTYYLYDDLGRLRCVVQPNAVTLRYAANDWTLSTTDLDELCFRYEYDQRGRMITKKVPGAAPVYMIYDPWDRLLLTQDGVQRANHQYLMYKYDALDRSIATGIYTYYGTIDQVRQIAMTYAPYRNEELRSSPSGGAAYTSRCWPEFNYELLTETYYDDYSWLVPAGNPFGTSYYSADNGLFYQPSDINFPYPQPLTQSHRTNGLVTGTRTKVLGSSQYLYAITYYDNKGRVLQTQALNITGCNEIATNQYSFSGQLVATYHLGGSCGASFAQGVLTRYQYDNLGRLLTLKKTVYTTTGQNSGEKTVLQNEYDEQGQLKTKKLGIKPDASGPLETLVYDYNIRGWILGANRDYAKDEQNTGSYFGFDLAYDKPDIKTSGASSIGSYASGKYSGNIAGKVWKTKGDNKIRKYAYSYDDFNRLTAAAFEQHTGAGIWSSTAVNFSVDNLTYDANGNILSMDQWGLKIGGSSEIDKLVYDYFGSSNKLKAVTDNSTETAKLGDFKNGNSGDDYGYDVNGNMVTDLNKGIGSATGVDITSGGAITYNHLNLPKLIAVSGKGTIEYVYDAGGNKLKKIVTDNSVLGKTITTTTTYLGAAVYESRQTSPADAGDYTDKLLFIGHEEGRIRFEKGTTSTCPTPQPDRFVFDYFLKDHLGNVRMVLTEQQENICYIPATVEPSRIAVEKQVYDIHNGRVIDKLSTNASSISTFEDNIYRTHGGLNEKTGLGIVLKVMSGDQVRISAESFYTMPTGGASTSNMTMTDLLNAFVGSNSITSSKGGVSTGTVAGLGTNTDDLNNIINQAAPNNQAKAYLNWILFDDQLKYVSSGADPVASGSGDLYKLHTVFNNSPVQVSKNGFLYVYVSNESNLPVFFDNLAVTHTPGPILEETHYYPFGLPMASISSRKANARPNKEITFQGQQFDEELGLGWHQFKWRNHDPQIGRFIELDPLSEKYVYNSPFAFSENKVTVHIELEGLESLRIGHFWRAAGISSSSDPKEFVANVGREALEPKNWLEGAVMAGQIAVPIALTEIITGGFGGPTMARAQLRSSRLVAKSSTTTERATANLENATVNLEQRANEIHNTLPARTQRQNTTAVASATTADGKPVILVGSNEKALRPVQRAALQAGELATTGPGHAEVTVINHALANGMTVHAVAASRPICPNCATAIQNVGAQAGSSLKTVAKPRPASDATYLAPQQNTVRE